MLAIYCLLIKRFRPHQQWNSTRPPFEMFFKTIGVIYYYYYLFYLFIYLLFWCQLQNIFHTWVISNIVCTLSYLTGWMCMTSSSSCLGKEGKPGKLTVTLNLTAYFSLKTITEYQRLHLTTFSLPAFKRKNIDKCTLYCQWYLPYYCY